MRLLWCNHTINDTTNWDCLHDGLHNAIAQQNNRIRSRQRTNVSKICGSRNNKGSSREQQQEHDQGVHLTTSACDHFSLSQISQFSIAKAPPELWTSQQLSSQNSHCGLCMFTCASNINSVPDQVCDACSVCVCVCMRVWAGMHISRWHCTRISKIATWLNIFQNW